ncbi:hypothetical protein CBW65_03010 [Tumebacillus avium]|uniref:DUF2975 domain-containing protein n=1 Tax=Tumebacillus avium TaxID=1903704 RepID=A0A1Y0IIK6_9BACL|nr:hypothetical protein [Tumebacillus avium]ARU60140.1 hypothetical protein CBW65_03010 [Tumebacillus avium]
MLHKFIVALLATFILSLWISYPSLQVPQSDTGSYKYSFIGLMTIYITYVGPCMFLLGIPFSMLIDRIARRRTISSALGRYLFHFLLYALAGLLAIMIFLLVLSSGDLGGILDEGSGFIYFGVIGSLLFYHVSLLLLAIAKLFKKRPDAS